MLSYIGNLAKLITEVIKIVIADGNVASAADVIESVGNTTSQLAYEQVVSDATNWTNTDYLGADEFTDADGSKATINVGDSSATWETDYYRAFDVSVFSDVTYYAIIEATTGPVSSEINGIYKFAPGKWIIYDVDASTSSTELERAVVHKKLWSDGWITDFTSVTSLQLPDSNDVGMKGIKISGSGCGGSQVSYWAKWTGTFGTTTDNNISSWSNLVLVRILHILQLCNGIYQMQHY